MSSPVESGPASPDHNFISYLDRWANGAPDRPALMTPIDKLAKRHLVLTFRELHRSVTRLASGLAAAGVLPGDRILVMAPMSQELYLFVLAHGKLGAITVLVDPWVGLDQVRAAARLVAPRCFVAPAVIHALAWTIREFREIPLKISTAGVFVGTKLWERVMASGLPHHETAAVMPSTTAIVTFTTGSSGLPKGVNRTHGFLVAQHSALSHHLGRHPQDVSMPALPMFILHHLAAGIPSVVPAMKPSRPADVSPEVLVRQIREFGVTILVGSPAFFEPIATWLEDRFEQFTGVRAIFTGGGPVPPGLMERLIPLLPNGKAYVGYGSSEAEPVALISAQEIAQETAQLTRVGRGTCVGHLAHGITARIIRWQEGPVIFTSWENLALQSGEIGEIVVAGPHVNQGYYRNREGARENKIEDGTANIWHRMGDLGYFDQNGRLWLVGRCHNRVMRGEAILFPIMVEGLAASLPWIKRSALVGLPDSRLGQRAVLAIEIQGPPQVEQLRAALALAGFQIDAIAVRRKLPVDSRHNAKIDYGKLRHVLTLTHN